MHVTNNSATIIDHIYSCNADVTYADACNLNLADHFAAICCMSCSSTGAGISLPHPLSTYCFFKSLDAEVLRHVFQSYPWNVITTISNIDDKVKSFNFAFMDIMEQKRAYAYSSMQTSPHAVDEQYTFEQLSCPQYGIPSLLKKSQCIKLYPQ